MNKQRAGKKEWIGLAVLILPTLLLSIDVSVLHLAVPALSEDLRPTGAQLLWINDIYGFLIAGFLIPMGTLGDRIGRRKVLLIGAVAFALASVVAAYAPTAEVLIAARAVLGVAGATLMPSTLSLIRSMFHDPAQRTTAISLWMTGFTGGMVIGPLLGGALLEAFWWGAAFLLGVPVMVLLLTLGPALLPEYRAPSAGRIDVLSVALAVPAALAVTYGVKELAAGGAGALAPLSLVVGLGLAVIFVRRQRRIPDPLLDLGLFAERRFSGALGTLVLVIMVGPGIGLLAAQYLQLVLGLSPLVAGLWTLPSTVAVIIGFVATPALARRIRPWVVGVVGLVVSAGGILLLTTTPSGGLAVLVIGHTLFFMGGSPLLVLGTDIVVGAAPPERSGSAAALSETAQEFGGAAGLAVFGSIAAAVYQARLTVPSGVSPEAAEAARDTLGGAIAVASGQPGSVAAALVEAARTAFTSGLVVTAVVAAATLLVAAALAAITLRHVPTLSSSATPEEEPASVS